LRLWGETAIGSPEFIFGVKDVSGALKSNSRDPSTLRGARARQIMEYFGPLLPLATGSGLQAWPWPPGGFTDAAMI
jgi:hypothetical protein